MCRKSPATNRRQTQAATMMDLNLIGMILNLVGSVLIAIFGFNRLAEIIA
jgi:hypothetical protein